MAANKLPLLHYADSYRDADQFYLSGFLCPDPFAVLEGGKRRMVAVSAMEHGRARKESSADEVMTLPQRVDRGASHPVLMLLRKLGFTQLRVLPSFPLGLARELEGGGIRLEVESADLADRRRCKSSKEIAAIESVQRRVEEGFAFLKNTLVGCPVSRGVLHHEGRPLTAERLRGLLEAFLLERGLESEDTIVAPGRGAADPHWRGSGPIRAGVPIVVDIFPRDRMTRYHSDMSRTFALGRVSKSVRHMHDAVIEAQDAALERLAPGESLAEVHREVVKVFSRRGYESVSAGRTVRRGFLHGTGHGLGLAVHEAPTLSEGGDELRPGDVVTVEPGLYDRRVGGVRIEDVVAVTPDGEVRNLTRFDRQMGIE